jgi:hypothetical protein
LAHDVIAAIILSLPQMLTIRAHIVAEPCFDLHRTLADLPHYWAPVDHRSSSQG